MVYFILGFVTATIILPITNGLIEVIMSWIEYAKTKPTEKILIANIKLQDLQADLEPVNTVCMGFEAPQEEYYDEEYYEDKKKNKIGFI